MSAEVRIDSYPFTQFGHIEGNLKAIGKEALPPDQFNPQARFPGYVKLSRQYLEKKIKNISYNLAKLYLQILSLGINPNNTFN